MDASQVETSIAEHTKRVRLGDVAAIALLELLAAVLFVGILSDSQIRNTYFVDRNGLYRGCLICLVAAWLFLSVGGVLMLIYWARFRKETVPLLTASRQSLRFIVAGCAAAIHGIALFSIAIIFILVAYIQTRGAAWIIIVFIIVVISDGYSISRVCE